MMDGRVAFRCQYWAANPRGASDCAVALPEIRICCVGVVFDANRAVRCETFQAAARLGSR